MEYILETENLCKTFHKQKANDNISLRVRKNTIYGLLGPNGAGKSTFLKMAAGMAEPGAGTILYQGKKIRRRDLAEVGALIENAPLYENLTARENLKVRTLMYGLSDSRIDEVLEIVNLRDTGKKKAGKFSMGMKQKLGIAIALLNHPKLLILDELTNGLFLPFLLLYVAASSVKKEKKWNYHGLFTIASDKKKIWYAKIAAATVNLFLTSLFFSAAVLLLPGRNRGVLRLLQRFALG